MRGTAATASWIARARGLTPARSAFSCRRTRSGVSRRFESDSMLSRFCPDCRPMAPAMESVLPCYSRAAMKSEQPPQLTAGRSSADDDDEEEGGLDLQAIKDYLGFILTAPRRHKLVVLVSIIVVIGLTRF